MGWPPAGLGQLGFAKADLRHPCFGPSLPSVPRGSLAATANPLWVGLPILGGYAENQYSAGTFRQPAGSISTGLCRGFRLTPSSDHEVDVDVPMLMGPQRLPKTRAFLRELARLPADVPRRLKHPISSSISGAVSRPKIRIGCGGSAIDFATTVNCMQSSRESSSQLRCDATESESEKPCDGMAGLQVPNP